MKASIDINCDMGETFGRWLIGDSRDCDLIRYISSANIAAGFHAGDPNVLHETIALAVKNNVAIGVHPGYHDLQGFGRRKIVSEPQEIINDIIYQVGAVREFSRLFETDISHIKAHGALYMELAVNPVMSQLLIEYMRKSAPNIPVFCMDRSKTCALAKTMGQPVIREFYADRDYGNNGSIVFTRNAGRPDPKAIAQKVLRACCEGKVRTVEDEDITIEFESICFHSDTLGALDIVCEMRTILEKEGITIQSAAYQSRQKQGEEQ